MTYPLFSSISLAQPGIEAIMSISFNPFRKLEVGIVIVAVSVTLITELAIITGAERASCTSPGVLPYNC
jgi:hypothetical protein